MTANDFALDASKSFEENFEAFLAGLESVDKDMAAILHANADTLAKIVREGERDSNARATFNAEIAKALDTLVASPARSDT
jgi:hypothetical protein